MIKITLIIYFQHFLRIKKKTTSNTNYRLQLLRDKQLNYVKNLFKARFINKIYIVINKLNYRLQLLRDKQLNRIKNLFKARFINKTDNANHDEQQNN